MQYFISELCNLKVRHVALCLAVSAFFFQIPFLILCTPHPSVTYNTINMVLLPCRIVTTKLYGMMVSLRNMRVSVQFGRVCSYIGWNVLPCLYAGNVICMDNVQKLNIAFNS
jgi:hypothetical protein